MAGQLQTTPGEWQEAGGFPAAPGCEDEAPAETDAALILMSDKVDALTVGVEACADRVPLIYAATHDNSDALANFAKENKCPMVIKAIT